MMDNLPDEILLRILSHMEAWELIELTQHVSRRWRCLSHDPEVWRGKEFSIASSCADYVPVTMLQQMPQLRYLRMLGNIKPSIINVVCDNLSHLTTLEIGFEQEMSVPLVAKLVERCPNIRSLALPHQLLCDRRKAQSFAELPLQSMQIRMDYATRNRRIYLRAFADACPELSKLDVTGLCNIRVRDLQYFFRARSQTLTHVTIPWAMCTRYKRRRVFPFLGVCTTLTHIILSDCNMFYEDELSEALTVLGGLPNLRSLSLGGLQKYPTGLAALAFESIGLSQLEVLNIDYSNVEENVVSAVCRGCPQLRVLSLTECFELTDEALRHLYLLTKLEVLDLSGCQELSGEALKHVARVKTLRKLFLKKLNARRLEPDLERILDITTLETLSFKYTENASIFPFDRLPGKLVHLRVLDMRGARMNAVLAWLRKQMPGLQVYTSWA